MVQLPPQVEHAIKVVDDFMRKYPVMTQYERFKQVEEKTGYSKVYFFLVGSAVLTGLLTLLGGAKLLVDLVGFLYPAYMSFKSMDAGSTDDTQWLTYWVVFSFVSIVESLLGVVVSWIPFYFWIKVALVVWMYHPSTRGAALLYEQGLRPLLLPYLESASSSSSTTKKAE